MVRLRREIEGLRRKEGQSAPAYLSEPGLRSCVDAPFFTALEQLEWDEGGRVLGVGLEPHSLLELLDHAAHLTVVEPDPESCARVNEALKKHPRLQSVTVLGKPYGEAGFEASSFDLSVIFDELNMYASPGDAARKSGRELKVGGKLFARVTVGPLRSADAENDAPELQGSRWLRRILRPFRRRFESVWDSAAEWAFDWDEFVAASDGGLQIDAFERVQVLAPPTASLIAQLPPPIRGMATRALPSVCRVDESLGQAAREERTATAWLMGSKALGLGKVFRT